MGSFSMVGRRSSAGGINSVYFLLVTPTPCLDDPACFFPGAGGGGVVVWPGGDIRPHRPLRPRDLRRPRIVLYPAESVQRPARLLRLSAGVSESIEWRAWWTYCKALGLLLEYLALLCMVMM